LFRKGSTTALACTLVLALVSLACFPEHARAQHTKVPKEPFQVIDASTGKTIPEILVIPLYSSYKGVFVPPEGPSKTTVRIYLDNPFVYRTGEPFVVKQPRVFTGLPLIFVFIGKGTDLNGILVIASGYRPVWTDDLWWYPGNPDYERKLWLYPISDSEWSQLSEKELSPFLKGASRIHDNCQMWDLPEHCNLKIQFDKKERELVRSFLQQARKETK
jgi:hypothetical protein